MTAQPDPHLDVPADPEHDPRASFAIDPALARRLSVRVVGTGAARTTYAPFTGQPIASLPGSTPHDVAAVAQAAREAQRGWAELPLDARSRVLLDFHDLVLDRQADLLDLIQWESGKSRQHAFEEIAHLAMSARYYGRTAHDHLDTRRRRGMYPVLTRIDHRRVPKGVVGIISPWNYPLTMALSDGLPAVLAGNAIVHKPDSQTGLSALLGIELLVEAGLPDDVWQVVLGDGPTIGSAIIDVADFVCFTGSTATGREVGRRAAERLIGCSLELGGKNPMLVLRDADIERAAEGAVRGCFSSAGQLCVSMERVYVADQVYERFMQRFVRRAESLRLGVGIDYSADLGSLVSADQLAKVSAHVDDARAGGATVITGGRHRPDVGPLFYEPTILTGVRPGMRCFAEETFGPVVSVYRFVDEHDATARANEGDFGLNASIFTRDAARGRHLAKQIRCGTVNVNEGYAASFGSIESPMGGMKDSGLGRRQGADGILRFTESQVVATQRVIPVAPILGTPDEVFNRAMTGLLRVFKTAGRP